MSVLESIKDEYISSKDDVINKELDDLREDLKFIPKPKDLGDYTRYEQALLNVATGVKNLSLKFDIQDIKKLLESYYQNKIDEYNDKEFEINSKYEEILNNKIAELESEAKEHNSEVVNDFNERNAIYLQLEDKRKQLEQYSDEIIDLCSIHGITTSDVDISNSSFTVDELNSIYDDFLKFMNEKRNPINPIRWFRDKFDDSVFQGVALLIVFLLMFTPVLDVIAVAFLCVIIYSQLKAKDDMKTYSVLLGLVFNIRPLEMGFEGDFDESDLVDEEVDEDNDERLNSVADEWEKALNELDAENPNDELDRERLNLTKELSSITEEFETLTAWLEDEKRNFMVDIKHEIDRARKEFEELKANIKLLGTEISTSTVFNTNFKLGCKDGVLEESIDIGLSNIIVKPSGNEIEMKMFLQVLMANALCNVKANNLSVIIYDPNKFGQDLVSFYSQDLMNVIEFKNDGLDKIVADLKAYAMKNMKEMRGSNINEFNEAAEKVGKTPKDYKLLIVLSQPKKIEEDEALSEFMSYSAALGVFVWLVSSKTLPNTVVFKKPFDKVENPYKIDLDTFGPMVSNNLVEAIKNSKSEGLPWDDFINIAVPEDKIWTYTTDKYVDLDPGFWNGDPTAYKGYTIGNDGNVHVLAVGGTGAGKSVFLNHLIATATRKYSPRELELWLVDFKGSEFKFYMKSEEHPYMLPHIKACLCTSDADYSGSLYSALRKVAEDRYQLLKDTGFKNMKDYNQSLRAQGRENETVPRILFINDEFQVIFEKAEPKILEQIKKDITYISKVARAAGVHFLFTSQSMKGTVSADILQQFTLRFALRCDEEVSMSILGSKNASNIREKFGYLYAKSLEDKTPESQKRYRTPFISDDRLREHIKQMSIMAEEQNMPKHDVITYEEATKHPIEELDAFYDSVKDSVPEYGAIFLGNRMTYSTNRAPDNVVLGAANNTHIMSAFSDMEDLVNFYKEIRVNISHFKTEATVFCNSQVADIHYLCELDKESDSPAYELSTEKTSIYELLELFQNIYNMRVENNIKDQPAYFILLGWNKAVGFGIDKDSSFASEFAKLLQICGEYNMHFIFINTANGAIGNNVITACKYLICGKVDEPTSYNYLDGKQGCKSYDMKNGYMFIRRGSDVTRAKLYLSKQEREIKKSEFVL